MPHPRRAVCTVAALAVAALVSGTASGQQAPRTESPREGDRKPSLSLKANPPVGFSPLRVQIVAELRGGVNDYEDFYCASVEWDWGDGTVSENSEDCDPFVAGKSEIRRRYTATHTYRFGDNYRPVFRLKQKSKVVGAVTANVQVRPGVRDGLER